MTALLESQHRRVFRADDFEPPWQPHGTLCLLGAGNSNDVDLRRLLRKFSTIELVDIDQFALSRGVGRQFSLEDSVVQRVKLHANVDLLGIDALEVNGSDVAATLSRGIVATNLRSLLDRRCDVAAAAGLFSMLVVSLGYRMGFDEMFPLAERVRSGWDEALDALRRSYMMVLASIVRPGGAVVHVSDLAYRADAAPDSMYSESVVESEHLKANDFFPGVHPSTFLRMDAGGRLSGGALWDAAPAASARASSLSGSVRHPYWVWCTSFVAEATRTCSLAYGVTWTASHDEM